MPSATVRTDIEATCEQVKKFFLEREILVPILNLKIEKASIVDDSQGWGIYLDAADLLQRDALHPSII